jgi:hypothetical protein
MGESVLLLGVDETLFKMCFGDDESWSPGRLESLDETCSQADLEEELSKSGCVIIQEKNPPHWGIVKRFYQDGGFVVYFGIEGEFDVPSWLSKELGLQWRFSAYTKHDYELTDIGKEILGDTITEQQYTKANLLEVPDQDKILAPKIRTFEQYLEDNYGPIEECEDYEIEEARSGWGRHQRELAAQVPLAMHTNERGGRIAFLGFVNGDGNIPQFVRALCCQKKVTTNS